MVVLSLDSREVRFDTAIKILYQNTIIMILSLFKSMRELVRIYNPVIVLENHNQQCM